MKKARIAIIGTGWWAVENHIPILKQRPDVDLVGICSLGSENLQRVQRAFAIPYATESYQDLLDHVPLDGVVISSPHVCHFEQAKAALERKYHVLVEKPLTTNSEQARELTRLEQEQGTSIVVPFGYNFSELAAAACGSIGLMGEIRHATLHIASATASLFLGERVTWAKDSLVEPEAATWGDAGKAGGFGWGQLSHALGLLFLLVDSPAASVFAHTVRAGSGVDLFDAATARLECGAIVAISGSSGLAPHARAQLQLRLFGSEGHLTVDFEREVVEIFTISGETLRPEISKGAGIYRCRRPVEFFVDVCLGRSGANPGSGLIGCRSTEVLDALYRSADSRREELV